MVLWIHYHCTSQNVYKSIWISIILECRIDVMESLCLRHLIKIRVLWIRDSFNISSISDEGTGRTQINFSNNFSNNSYSVVCGGSRDQPEGSRCFPSLIDQMTTSKYRLTNHNDGNTVVDWALTQCAVFGE